MIILRPSVPRWSSTRSPMWISRARHGRETCSDRNRL
jgi:hypothetical protein